MKYTNSKMILFQAITKNLAMHDGSRIYFRSTAASSNKKVKTLKVNNFNGFYFDQINDNNTKMLSKVY